MLPPRTCSPHSPRLVFALWLLSSLPLAETSGWSECLVVGGFWVASELLGLLGRKLWKARQAGIQDLKAGDERVLDRSIRKLNLLERCERFVGQVSHLVVGFGFLGLALFALHHASPDPVYASGHEIQGPEYPTLPVLLLKAAGEMQRNYITCEGVMGSLARILVGSICGVLCGLALAVAVHEMLGNQKRSVLAVGHAVAATAIIPIVFQLIAFLPFPETLKPQTEIEITWTATLGVPAFWISLFLCSTRLDNLSPALSEVARFARRRRLWFSLHVQLPYLLPRAFDALRMGVIFAFTLLPAVESRGSGTPHGIGKIMETMLDDFGVLRTLDVAAVLWALAAAVLLVIAVIESFVAPATHEH